MSDDLVQWIAVSISLVLAVMVALRFWRDYRHKESNDYLTEATRLLELAHEGFSGAKSADWHGLPRPDRLLWLSVARRLQDSQAMASKISEKSHKAIYRQTQKYWRSQMYELLQPMRNVPLTYFAEQPDWLVMHDTRKRAPIAWQSIRVIMDFLNWPECEPDTMASVREFSEDEIERIESFEFRPLGEYLFAVKDFSRGSDDDREHWRRRWAKIG